VSLDDGEHVVSRAMLFASGVRDTVPDIPGFRECYGISVHHCPYCDGWEASDRRLIVTGRGRGAGGLALSLKTWSAHVAIASNGPARMPPTLRAQLEREGIATIESTIDRLDHDEGRARRIVFSNGESRACEAVFFSGAQAPQSDLPARLGCELTRKGVVKTDHLGQTCVPGVYVVGDASRDVQFAIVAAAEGAKAAVAINKALQAQSGLAIDAPYEQPWPTVHPR
jgi:thioredoxin reductase